MVDFAGYRLAQVARNLDRRSKYGKTNWHRQKKPLAFVTAAPTV